MDDSFDKFQRELQILVRHIGSAQRSLDVAHRLDRSAAALLSQIELEGPMSIGELGESLGLDASTLNRQTAAAVRAGIAERIIDPDGGAAKKFVVTDLGRQRLEQERVAMRQLLAELTHGWSDEQVAQFASTARELNERYELRDGHHWARP